MWSLLLTPFHSTPASAIRSSNNRYRSGVVGPFVSVQLKVSHDWKYFYGEKVISGHNLQLTRE